MLSVADYDKLSPEEQKAHDQALADQEAAEQAGESGLQSSTNYLKKCTEFSVIQQPSLIAGNRLYKT
jgi:hypothetical protein